SHVGEIETSHLTLLIDKTTGLTFTLTQQSAPKLIHTVYISSPLEKLDGKNWFLHLVALLLCLFPMRDFNILLNCGIACCEIELEKLFHDIEMNVYGLFVSSDEVESLGGKNELVTDFRMK
ncbi:hypothetical protein ACJX0J_035413, partial [Zea mays]